MVLIASSKRVLLSLFVSIILAFAALFGLKPPATTPANDAHAKAPKAEVLSHTEHYLIRLEIENLTAQLLEHESLDFKLPLNPTSRNQSVQWTVNTPTASQKEPVTRNIKRPLAGYTSLAVPLTAPYGFSQIDIQMAVTSVETALAEISLDPKLRQRYLAPSRFIQSRHPDIVEQASQLRRSAASDAQQVADIHQWVVDNLNYSGFKAQNQGALYALTEKQGDCTEYSYLTTALLRANGFPARVAVGFAIAGQRILRARDLHNWVEVYLDGAWQILDPQNDQLYPKFGDYVQLGIVDEANASLGIWKNSSDRYRVSF
ncbi:transglutaminase-like domain-containing protein [Vibrio nigripulchritudo]|uniref:transglutaminase-like domain-containing protein n=1 Tax=Vibrio nigripulchritudo TaxID=28173 RepID=UPI00248F58FA|nr:transglutaminase domain-containing protein [Vibrio nigripulchritudo]BDU40249.1 hypothetical protein TUMSATVNIG2_47180 [Vibrio nigripulchritudo]BDU45984.1 hypothetical protein TUMSATVNIG3_47820 [Vibrio nigripulchritudo]